MSDGDCSSSTAQHPMLCEQESSYSAVIKMLFKNQNSCHRLWVKEDLSAGQEHVDVSKIESIFMSRKG